MYLASVAEGCLDVRVCVCVCAYVCVRVCSRTLAHTPVRTGRVWLHLGQAAPG